MRDIAEAELPEGLRLATESTRLEVAGRRARAVESADGAVELVIDGAHARIELDPPLASGAVQSWPFAAVRESGGMHDTLFAAAEQPVVMLERRGATRARRAGDARVELRANGVSVGSDWLALEPDGRGRIRIVAQAGGGADADVDALLNSAIARARRRAAQRPRVRVPDLDGDPLPTLEHALRLHASHPEVTPDQLLQSALALLALNDASSALDVLRAGEADIAGNAAHAVVAAGAWAAWRGAVLPLERVRAAARTRATAAVDDSDPWSHAASALAPYATDVGGSTAGEQRREAPDAGSALAHLARSDALGAPAARVLALMHGRLGLMPDAARARIRLAPRLVAGATEIMQIGVAEATFALYAVVADERASIEIEQTSGATPFTAILEPRVPGGRLRSALVESTPAELESDADEAGLVVRVQIVIDRRRSMVLDYEGR